MSDVTLKINDTLYGGWKQVSVTTSIENLSGTFQLSVSDKWAGQTDVAVIKPTDSCELSIDGQVIITGYVDRVYISLDGGNHTITVNGRDKTADLIDCSVVGGTGQFKNLTLVQIIERICDPFGITVSSDVNVGDVFKTFNIEQGASAYDSIQKICQARACLAMSDGAGGLLITRAGSAQNATPLVQGVNILTGTAEYDYSYRYSQYICKGQLQGIDGDSADVIAGNTAKSFDDGLGRYRPLVVIFDGQATPQNCQTRADWERNTRKGRSRRFTISVAGWLQPISGKLWALNQQITLKSDVLGVFDKLLIASVSFDLSDGGEITTLELTSPDAYLTDLSAPVNINQNPYLVVDE